MKLKVVVVDCGIGNLLSVSRSVEISGLADAVVSSNKDDILSADRLILPGVGAFDAGMSGLRERGLVDPILKITESKTPTMGICLGMQMLATLSEEFGTTSGLNLIPGKVEKIPSFGVDGVELKVPFVGWAALHPESSSVTSKSYICKLSGGAVYLVHSFQFIPDNSSHVIASYKFGGHSITAAVQNENIIGLQFHPEKSGEIGLKIIKDFVSNKC
jgi:glutamine amidotransferase